MESGAESWRRELQKAKAKLRFRPDGWPLAAGAGKMGGAASGRRVRRHGSVSMRLPIPTIQNFEQFDEGLNMGLFEDMRKSRAGLWSLGKGAGRFAPGRCGGALPRTPASFTLNEPRFAGREKNNRVCCRNGFNWWASRWLSASRRWRCRPSQPRTGLANRFPGFWSDRTPLAHNLHRSCNHELRRIVSTHHLQQFR